MTPEIIQGGMGVYISTPFLANAVSRNGALGTVSEIANGVYTGKLAGAPLHGPAKAEAVRALAERENLRMLQ